MSDYASEPDTGVSQVFLFILYLNDKPDFRTGIAKVIALGGNLLGPLPQTLVRHAVSRQINQFGAYPDSSDFAPSLVFTIVFAILWIIHLLIFLINLSRGHYFYVSMGWILYCSFRVIGFSLRLVWSQKVERLAIGLTSEVFSIVASIVVVSFNLILAQRLFTWRHPVGGSRKLFWAFMLILYAFVVILVGITVTAAFVPYLNYLSTASFLKWQAVVKFSCVMIIVYSLTSVALLGLSYWAPTRKDENLYTYQPWWIESFSTFYFVKKGAAKEADETFAKRNSNHRHAVRVIAATKHHHNIVEGLSADRGTLSHNLSIFLIIYSTAALLVAAILRAIVIFDGRTAENAREAGTSIAMYMIWGFLEATINIAYIVWRVDLRFYRPDALPHAIRNFVSTIQSGLQSGQRTGNQSEFQSGQMTRHYASDAESYDQYGPESFVDVDSQDDLYFEENNTYARKMSYLTESSSFDTPYPRDEEKKDRDDSSDFRF